MNKNHDNKNSDKNIINDDEPHFFSKPFRNENMRFLENRKSWEEFHQEIKEKIEKTNKEQRAIYWHIWRIHELIYEHFFDYEFSENPNNFADYINTYLKKYEGSELEKDYLVIDNRIFRLDSRMTEIGLILYQLELELDRLFNIES